MIILGIDPGEMLIGFGVIQQSGHKLTFIDCGCIRISKKHNTSAQKLVELEIELTSLIKKYRPDRAGVEDIFFFKNAKTVIKVAQARGVILATLKRENIHIHEFTPLQVKQSVSGYGKAEKTQVQKMVALILNLTKPITQDDAADAVAVAICTSSTILKE